MANNRPFEWPDGKRVAVSLSFDDARPSQLDSGIPILDRYGVKATFYVSFARLDQRLDRWRGVSDRGHEIGNHSLRHACSGNFGWKKAEVLEDYTFERMDTELEEANARIADMFGAPATTFAYPCGQTYVGRGLDRRSYVPAVAKHFLVGRGFRDEFYNDPTFCDLAKVGGTEFDRLSFAELVTVTEQAATRGYWVVLAGHDVGGNGRQVVPTDALDAFCAYCRDPTNGVWIDTVATIGDYVHRTRGQSDA